MRTLVKLAISAALALVLPAAAMAQMEAQIKQKLQEKHEAAQPG